MEKDKEVKKTRNNPSDMQNNSGIIVDPDGSWTGVPIDGDRPVQDVDDL